MVPQCFMLLCPYVCDLQQYGHLNNSCQFYILFCSVLQFKIEKNVRIDVTAVLNYAE